jgi:hypothetical protein
MNKILNAFDNLKMTQDLVKFIDTKANILLVLYGLIITNFLKQSEGVGFINPGQFTEVHLQVLAGVVLVLGLGFWGLVAFQLYHVIFGIITPRLSKSYKPEECSSFYFEHIACTDRETYKKNFMALDEEAATGQVLDQIYAVAGILAEKTRHFKIAVRCLFPSVILLLLYYGLSVALRGKG